MDDMGSMDMGSGGSFKAENQHLALSYWYINAGILGFTVFIQVIDYIQTSIRIRTARSRSVNYPTKPQNSLLQAYATGTAIARELSSPEVYIPNRWVAWLSPPPLGRSIVIISYWVVILYMLVAGSIIKDALYWERIGYRAAWISVTQVPFVYLLASKSSIIGVLSGSSHERLNWLHRWVSRTLLITVTIHGSFFFREWILSDFVALELQIMPMVKYGMGAWFVLLWTLLSSLTPIRRLSYEVFVLQHLAAACVFLWLIYVHVPSYAQYNVWFAISALVFDKAFLLLWTTCTNLRFRPSKSVASSSSAAKILGHNAELRVLDDETTEVLVRDVTFKWRPGQHVYLRLPSLNPTQSHPFTIANVCNRNNATNDIQLIIQAQSGFTKRLHRKASSIPASSTPNQPTPITAIVTGPFGAVPNWKSFETLILISASTGSSFTIPILEEILSKKPGLESCVTRIEVLMIVRRRCGMEYYLDRLRASLEKAREIGLEVHVTVSITGMKDPSGLADIMGHGDVIGSRGGEEKECQCGVGSEDEVESEESDSIDESSSSSSSSTAASTHENEKLPTTEAAIAASSPKSPLQTQPSKPTKTKFKVRALRSPPEPCCCGTSPERITFTCGRPDLEGFIRAPVEESGGETGVAVCGGDGLVSCVRNFCGWLSDERGVHKGTGAQGVAVWGERYCF